MAVTTVLFRVEPSADNLPFMKEEGNCEHLGRKQDELTGDQYKVGPLDGCVA